MLKHRIKQRCVCPETRYIFANGDIYDGDFQRDQACGQGIYRTAASGNGAGDCYVGGWESDLRHGKGTLRWGNGSRYEVRRWRW